MLPVGAVLDNRYRIIRYLASGGFGNTYVAEDSRLGGEVAVKEFFIRGTNHRSDDGTTVDVSNVDNKVLFDTQLEKFKREAARIFKLHNDHIIHVFDLFEANGTSYYVMDLVKGTSLSVLVREHPLSEAEAMDVIFQVLDALKAMHASGLYHLDIKPGNIMRDASGHCTLIDFGASKQFTADERNTLSSVMAYTPGYAAIEQIAQQTKNIGPWTDFYALGATFYCLLTGNRPPEVDADDTASDGRQFPYPSEVSERSRRAIAAMMNPSRRLRPQSADEVFALLEDDTTMVMPIKESPHRSMDEETLIVDPKPNSPAVNEASSNSLVGYNGDERAEDSSSNRKYFVFAIVAAVLGLGGYLAWNSGLLSKSVQSESSNSVENSSLTQETKSLDPVIQQLIDNMVEVDGGTFTMGATYEQDYSDIDEYPIHEVTLSSYKIGRYEVTQEEWEAVMGYNPASFVSPKRPVEFVSWDDCQEFIRKLNDMTGKNFRMPTEAEWEFAARGGNRSNGYKYAGGDNVNKVGWYSINSGGRTKEVGLKSPNELGLYDMTGNLWEWCSDWYGSYDGEEQTTPSGPGYGSSRVLRGGGWNGGDKNCRVSNRDGRKPDYSSDRLGLRLVL